MTEYEQETTETVNIAQLSADLDFYAVEYHLLHSDTSIDSVYGFSRRTALHYAAIKGNMPLVTLLITLGANIDAKDRDGRTPLHFAALRGHASVCTALLAAGAGAGAGVGAGAGTERPQVLRESVLEVEEARWKAQKTILEAAEAGLEPEKWYNLYEKSAKWFGHRRLCDVLCNDFNRPDLSVRLISPSISTSSYFLHLIHRFGAFNLAPPLVTSGTLRPHHTHPSALHFAATHCTPLYLAMLRHGWQDHRDSRGRLAAQLAAAAAAADPAACVLAGLRAEHLTAMAGAEVVGVSGERDRRGRNWLHYAAEIGVLHAQEQGLRDLCVPDSLGWTPLALAVEAGAGAEVVGVLWQAGAGGRRQALMVGLRASHAVCKTVLKLLFVEPFDAELAAELVAESRSVSTKDVHKLVVSFSKQWKDKKSY